MVAALVQWVVHKSCSFISEFTFTVYNKHVLCTCSPVLAYGQGRVGHPALEVWVESSGQALDVLRSDGVSFPFFGKPCLWVPW